MNCQQARKWMSPYLDSELGATKTFEVSEHLRACPPCTARFEAERQADAVMARSLTAEAMPDALWQDIVESASSPPRLRFLAVRRYWALAACLALAAGIWFVARPQTAGRHDSPAVVHHFAAQAPHDEPFKAPGPETGLAALNATLRDLYGMAFSISPDIEASGHTPFEVVSAIRRTDERGREFLEIRLNCCGKPALMVLARPTQGAWPLGLEQLAGGARPDRAFGGVYMEATELGPVRAVVTSRHSVEHILSGLRRLDA